MSSNWYLILASAVTLAAQTQSDLREAARLDQAGRCDEAEIIYRRALVQGEPGPALLNNTGNHYLTCGSRDKARPYFERVIRIQPLHLNANLQLARMAMSAGEYSRAEDLLQNLAAARPAEFDVLLLLGRASSRLGHLQRARDTLGKVLLWTFVITLAVLYLGAVFGPPPPSVAALAATSLAGWLFVAWGYWIDRHRVLAAAI